MLELIAMTGARLRGYQKEFTLNRLRSRGNLLQSGSIQQLLQLIQKTVLPREQLLASSSKIAPHATIDFRKLLSLARPRRPFHRERVALERGRIDLSLYRPSRNHFSARLLERSECMSVSTHLGTGFLLKLPLGGRERIFAFAIFAFRDRPGAVVLLCPEGSAGMDEEYLNSSVALTI